MSRFYLAVLCFVVAFSTVLPAQTTYLPPVPPGAPAGSGVQMSIARSGKEVMITWSLGDLEIKQFEIFRHTRKNPTGRTRAAAVRTEPALYLDTVPDENATYWYWLKITLTSGQVLNIGPVTTPEAKVWTP